MEEADRILRIYGHGQIEAVRIRQFLADYEHSYSSISVFMNMLSEESLDMDRRFRLSRGYPFLYHDASLTKNFNEWPPKRGEIESHASLEDGLIIEAVRLESPGFWDFLGKLNPLEVTRKYLNDRHERRKDREYRESAERRKLELENLKLENEVIRERIDMARSVGVSEKELSPLFDTLVANPLRLLDRHQDGHLIEQAEWRESESEEVR